MFLCDKKCHDRLCWKPDRLPQTQLDRQANPGALQHSAHQLCAGTSETASEKSSGRRGNAAVGLGRNGFRIRIRTIARTHLALTSSRPGHTRVSSGTCTQGALAPDSDPTDTHPSRRSFGTTRRIRMLFSGSHLGSTLSPGGAVLTRGVSRRSGSVAYIRADASPTEVLAHPSWHRNPVAVKHFAKKTSDHPQIGADQTRSAGNGPRAAGARVQPAYGP
jgi:hypothetical protein